MTTRPDKQASGSRGSAHTEDETDKEDPTQGIPDWLQPFRANQEDLETRMCSHIHLKETPQIRKVMLQKWRHKNGSTVSILTSPKTEIATYA